MELDKKEYQITKTKNYLKTNKLFFFFNGTNKNAKEWLITEQHFKKTGYNSYKISNKPTIKLINKSIYLTIKPVISGITYLVKPTLNCRLIKNISPKEFEPLFFIALAAKFNNKIYSVSQIKKLNSFKYKNNKLVFHQFILTNTKSHLNNSE